MEYFSEKNDRMPDTSHLPGLTFTPYNHWKFDNTWVVVVEDEEEEMETLIHVRARTPESAAKRALKCYLM